MRKAAIITGITGQDGSYLAEDLLEQGIQVFGGIRRSASSPSNLERIVHLVDNPDLTLLHFDMMDACSVEKFVSNVHDKIRHFVGLGNYVEVYNLAAQSHVGDSFRIPTVTHQVNALGVITLLESLRIHFKDNFRFYQASTSELYGNVEASYTTNSYKVVGITENFPFNPESPYAIAKLAAHLTVKNYREAYGIHAVNGILFNHESPRRGVDFVTRKITRYVAQYALNRVPAHVPLQLGNLDAERDWGDAREYVKAMQLMVNEADDKKIMDYNVATGRMTSVRSFVEQAFNKIGITIDWTGHGMEEKGHNNIGHEEVLVEVNPELFRPKDVLCLLGNCNTIKTNLNWRPTVNIKDLISDMVEHDLELVKQEKV